MDYHVHLSGAYDPVIVNDVEAYIIDANGMLIMKDREFSDLPLATFRYWDYFEQVHNDSVGATDHA